MKTFTKLSVLAVLLFAVPVLAMPRFRVPLSMLDSQCARGRCYPTAYYDTNRSGSYIRDWACRTKTYNQHSGTDIGIGGWGPMSEGRWVMSAAPGRVVAAHDGEFDRCTSGRCGTANYVIIQHADGSRALYWHLKKWSVRVRVGQWVPCGVYIGQVGSSGYATGPHLHFEVQNASRVSLDPYGAVSASCGRTGSLWTSQGNWGGLPGNACQ